MGYDQYASFFANIRCYAVTGKVRIVNTGSIPIVFANAYSNSGSIASGVAQILEDPLTQETTCGVTPDYAELPVNLSGPRVLGMTSEQYRTEDNTIAAFGTSPNRRAFLLTIFTSAEFNQNLSLDATWDLVFHCELQGRKQLTQS